MEQNGSEDSPQEAIDSTREGESFSVDERKLTDSYRKLNSAMSGGMALWMVGLKSYQVMVEQWVSNRNKAMVKALVDLEEISNLEENERKAEATVDVLTEQWAGFYRDLLSTQLKAVADISARFDGMATPEEFIRKWHENYGKDEKN